MSRKWSEEQKRKFAEYDKANTVQVKFKFNKVHDADILEQLNRVNNKQGYVKQLIREDIKKERD